VQPIASGMDLQQSKPTYAPSQLFLQPWKPLRFCFPTMNRPAPNFLPPWQRFKSPSPSYTQITKFPLHLLYQRLPLTQHQHIHQLNIVHALGPPTSAPTNRARASGTCCKYCNYTNCRGRRQCPVFGKTCIIRIVVSAITSRQSASPFHVLNLNHAPRLQLRLALFKPTPTRLPKILK